MKMQNDKYIKKKNWMIQVSLRNIEQNYKESGLKLGMSSRRRRPA
jgi:hypothetical protein